MAFIPTELIRKKRFGGTHTREEIHFLVDGFAFGKIPDYQITPWLMAVCFRGMSPEETAWFTQEMRDSGAVLDWPGLPLTVDKHSTGGVGDKTSLILAPLVAAAGIPVPMMAGRGLGHTGGTLDKLETISGFSVGLPLKDFQELVRTVGTAIVGQTADICPADRKLYALRDVTGTVDSLPLICGSIMSKKLAAGVGALVLDVKYGSGAFMKSLADAEALARLLIDIGTRSGKKVVALLTRMDEPLGRFVGNALEVRECLDVLFNKTPEYDGKNPNDMVALTLELAGQMIHLGGKAQSPGEGRKLAEKLLLDGSAGKKFREMCAKQGGDLERLLPETGNTHVVKAERAGFMRYVDLEKMGLASVLLGAGRRSQADVIDPAAGIEVFREQGEAVKTGDTLFKLYASDKSRFPASLELLNSSFTVAAEAAARSPLVAKVIT